MAPVGTTQLKLAHLLTIVNNAHMTIPLNPPILGKNDAPGRRHLLEAAIGLFGDRGFKGTSVRDIAREAGVSGPLIKIHFGSKEGLRAAIDQYALDWIEGLYREAFESGERMSGDSVGEAAVRWLVNGKDVLMYVRMALMEKTSGSQALFRALLKITRSIVRTYDEDGRIAEDVDRQWAAIYLVFDMIGPAIVEPFAREEFGASMYDEAMIQSRNRFLARLLTRGFLQAEVHD